MTGEGRRYWHQIDQVAILHINVPAPVVAAQVPRYRLMKEPNSAGPRGDLHKFRPLDPVEARLDGQHLGGKALLGPVPDSDDKEHLERDGDRRE